MPRRAELLNSLTRGRVRASWNKYNLFNLYKKSRISFQSKNFYQQKWTAKQETRAYHGEHLTESRFKTNFSQKLESVAQLDASLRGETSARTPVLLQTYAVLEKRLDFALFRAMFASSVRQARQFILHGNVFVNDIKITQPGYQLKPGDVFHCSPEKVLSALGASKPSLKDSVKVTKVQIIKWNEYVTRAKKNPRKVWEEQQQRKKSERLSEEDKVAIRERVQKINGELDTQMISKQKEETKNKIFSSVLKLGLGSEQPSIDTFSSAFQPETARYALDLFTKATSSKELNPEILNGKNEQELSTIVSSVLAKEKQESRNPTEKKIISEVKQLLSSLHNNHLDDIRVSFNAKKIDEEAHELPYDPKWADSLTYHPIPDVAKALEDESSAKINLPFQKGLFGRADKKKTYFTPWKVRPFIAPFAILPSHIEISFETCHAVYMRDPVAYPGYSEVISPFSLPVHERAYMWYVNKAKRQRE